MLQLRALKRDMARSVRDDCRWYYEQDSGERKVQSIIFEMMALTDSDGDCGPRRRMLDSSQRWKKSKAPTRDGSSRRRTVNISCLNCRSKRLQICPCAMRRHVPCPRLARTSEQLYEGTHIVDTCTQDASSLMRILDQRARGHVSRWFRTWSFYSESSHVRLRSETCRGCRLTSQHQAKKQ